MDQRHDDVRSGGPRTTGQRFARLPERARTEDLVVEVPAFEDDRPQPEPEPPAAAPELVAATRFAQTSHATPTIRRTQTRAGLWIAGVPIAALAVVAVVQIVLGATG
ncbi:hypothetical protein C1N91_13275 [Curtobacterium sp. SGAir0471]|uniref:hypothetical protein n=1 Tax=Curtobacterium sp. SGAir0471 TaxID=2070337 RepID=UPI0010CCBD07|nr:hypothetical protein [Curtobacterium sp. SGAir0471]QCR44342.1 hypothetical protein C1N91_13275 [Curtobacterium sp. SGAir0471]